MSVSIYFVPVGVYVKGPVDELRACGFIIAGDAIGKPYDTVDNDGCGTTVMRDRTLHLSMSLDCARRRYPWFGRAE